MSDDAGTSTIHAALAARGLLPATHVADTGFVNAALFVEARERYGLDLIGPTRGDQPWQAKAGAGFAARDFRIDVAARRAGRARQRGRDHASARPRGAPGGAGARVDRTGWAPRP